MFDRFLSRTLWFAVIALICVTAFASLMLGYSGLVDLCARRATVGGLSLILSVPACVSCLLLVRHANDLMDR